MESNSDYFYLFTSLSDTDCAADASYHWFSDIGFMVDPGYILMFFSYFAVLISIYFFKSEDLMIPFL